MLSSVQIKLHNIANSENGEWAVQNAIVHIDTASNSPHFPFLFFIFFRARFGVGFDEHASKKFNSLTAFLSNNSCALQTTRMDHNLIYWLYPGACTPAATNSKTLDFTPLSSGAVQAANTFFKLPIII